MGILCVWFSYIFITFCLRSTSQHALQEEIEITQTDVNFTEFTTEALYDEIDIINDSNNSSSEVEPLFSKPHFNASLCSLEKPCVMKCCPLEQMMIHGLCSNNMEDMGNWTMGLYDSELNDDDDDIVIQYSFPMNPTNATCFVHDKKEFKVQRDGAIFYYEWEEVYGHKTYCLDTRISEENGEFVQFAALCYEPKQVSPFNKIARKVQIGCHIVSCICLVIILVIHLPAVSPRDLQEKSFICLCISLLLGFITIILNMAPFVVRESSYSGCLSLSLFSQYFLLSFYFWLAVRCYDILRVVRGSVDAVPISKLRNSDNSRFVKYCLISYGIPFAITIITAIVQHLPKEMVIPELRPNIGNGRCWIEEKIWALGVYYYGYQIILQTLNIIFMGISAYLLFKEGSAFQCCYKHHLISGVILNVHNKPSLQLFWQQFYVFMLYVIMWAFDSISLIHSKNHFWRIFDILNSLQGFFLLLIVLKCSPKRVVMYATIKRFGSSAITFSTSLKPKFSVKPLAQNSSNDSSRAESSSKSCLDA